MESVSIARHTNCPQCGSALVHLEWHERISAREVQDLWRRWNCRNEFMTIFTSDDTDPPAAEITKLFFTSLLA